MINKSSIEDTGGNTSGNANMAGNCFPTKELPMKWIGDIGASNHMIADPAHLQGTCFIGNA